MWCNDVGHSLPPSLPPSLSPSLLSFLSLSPSLLCLQVASHIQKYFIKLAKAGLPVPGRMPNMAAYASKGKKVYKHTSTTITLTQYYIHTIVGFVYTVHCEVVFDMSLGQSSQEIVSTINILFHFGPSCINVFWCNGGR